MMLKQKRNQGSTLAIVALLLVALLGMAALAVDLGIMYTARTSAQHAADAAALAGAETFLGPTPNEPTDAENAAIAVASQTKILGTPVSITASDVGVETAADGSHLVTVTVSRTGTNGIGTFLAKAIGFNRLDIRARARAQASPTVAATRCIKPVYVPNSVIAPPGTATSTACGPPTAPTYSQTLFYQTSPTTSELTSYANTWLQGSRCALMRPTNPSDVMSGGYSAGQFFSLDLGSGAQTYNCLWSSCANNPACGVDSDYQVQQCGKSYPVKTGDMVGPTRQGVDDLIGPNPDTWIGVNEYQNSVWGTVADSRSLALVPIWDNCVQVINSGTASQTAKIIGFALMFVDGMSNQNGCSGGGGGGGGGGGNWVKVHIVDAYECGPAGTPGPSGGGPASPIGVPVRLVQNP